MVKMVKFFKKNPLLIVILLLALFFYTFRLHQTFVMAGDTARDLNDVMRIWQNKEITVVGEPVNTIANNPTKVLFGSLHLYFGLVGLLVSGFDPVWSVFMNVVLALTSIPFFFLLANKYLKNKGLSYLATFIYALNPILVALTRSYWEPNTVLALSVFVWYFFLYKKSPKRYFLGGLMSGVVFYIHYVNFIPIGFYFIYLLFKEKKKNIALTILGFLIVISPLIAFELKNNFYLTTAFAGTFSGFSTFSERTQNPFLSMDILLYIFGLGPYQYFVPALFNIAFRYRILVGTVIGIPYLYFLFKRRKDLGYGFIIVVLGGLFTGWFFEKWHILAIRYMLVAVPLFIISFVAFARYLKAAFAVLLLIPMLALSIQIITHELDPKRREDYYPVRKIEEISDAIVVDNPNGRYNITENILGDARSLALRFYLLRDAEVKPQPVEVYDRINTLYVITPSLERIYEEDRWEFSASGPKEIVWEKDFGGIKLFKFVK